MNAIVTIEPAPTAGPHGAGHTSFSPRKQAEFIQSLQLFGNVRLACRAARVSSQTAYRQRRASPALADLWDAALLAARTHAEATLAERALNGVEEPVFYHGEEVARRRRFSDRLLLAHLARLDRMRGDERIEALAEDFDGMILRLRRGEPIEPEVAEPDPVEPTQEGRGTSSPGPCNRRSMSRAKSRASSQDDEGAGAASDPGEPRCDCVGARNGTDRAQKHYRRGAQGPEPVINVAGEGPCCDAPDWPQCRDCPHYPPVGRILREMEEDRPAGAPAPHEQGNGAAVEGVQIEAFCAGLAEWWLLTSEEELQRALAEGMGEDEEG